MPNLQELKEKLTDDLVEAIGGMLEYNWHEELKDAEEYAEENGGYDEHVFAHLVKINNWLSGINKTPEQYVEEHIS